VKKGKTLHWKDELVGRSAVEIRLLDGTSTPHPLSWSAKLG